MLNDQEWLQPHYSGETTTMVDFIIEKHSTIPVDLSAEKATDK